MKSPSTVLTYGWGLQSELYSHKRVGGLFGWMLRCILLAGLAFSTSLSTLAVGIQVNPVELSPHLAADFNAGSLGFYSRYLGVLSDGRILIGDGALNIRRLLPEGTVDPKQPTIPFARYGNSFGIQDEGKLIIAGDATISRLAADENTVEWSQSIASNQQIQHIAVQSDGKVIVAGTFETNGKTFALSRLTALGVLDTSFKPEINGQISALGLQADGKILVSGDLQDSNGNSRHLVRLTSDGRLDSGFNAAVGAFVAMLLVQPDGRVVVATLDQVFRLNADGQLDSSFTAVPFKPKFYGAVNSLALQANGSIIVAGEFSLANGQPWQSLARLSPNGALDPHFRIGFEGDLASVYATVLDRDGSLLMAGRLEKVDGKDVESIARLTNTEASIDNVILENSKITWSRGGAAPEIYRAVFDVWTETNQWVRIGEAARIAGGWELAHVSVSPGSRIRARGFLCGGTYSLGWYQDSYGGAPGIVMNYNATRSTLGGTIRLKALVSGTQPIRYQWRKNGVDLVDDGRITGTTTDGLTIGSAELQDEGEYVLVAINGFGTNVSASVSVTVNRLDFDESFDVSLNGPAYGIAIQSDGQILIGGEFTQVNGENRKGLARVTSDSQLDIDFDAHIEGSVNAIALDGDGRMIVGGSISNVAGYSRANLVRLFRNGVLDGTFNPQISGSVTAVAVQKDGKLVISGDFTSVNGQVRGGVARLEKDGQLDASFDPVVPLSLFISVSLMLDPEGGITVLGYGASTNGSPRSGMIRLRSNGTIAPGFESFPDEMGLAAVYRPDGSILVGSTISLSSKFQYANHVVAYRLDGGKMSEYPVVSRFGPPRRVSIYSAVDGSSAWTLSSLPPSVPYATFQFADFRGEPNVAFEATWAQLVQSAPIYALSAMAVDERGDILLANLNASRGFKVSKLQLSSTGSDELGYSSAQFQWVRSGKVPEFWRTTFEYSADGAEWSLLGDGVWSQHGWALPRSNALGNGWVRARGHLTGGDRNGSSYYIEKRVQLSSEPPQIVVGEQSPRFESGRFWFQIAGAEGQWVIVEESDDLTSWRVLPEKRLAGSVTDYTVSASPGAGRRFYRVRLMP